jgi:hypothetical protein
MVTPVSFPSLKDGLVDGDAVHSLTPKLGKQRRMNVDDFS